MNKKKAPGATGAASDKRRAQVRQAQKAYHARKKQAHSSLEARVHQLEGTVQGMYDTLLRLNDNVLASPSCRGDPALIKMLEAALQRALTLTDEAFGGEDRPGVSDDSTAPDDDSTATRNSSLAPAISPELAPLRAHVVIRHPLAARVFPPTRTWSRFAARLYHSTIAIGIAGLQGIHDLPHPKAWDAFRYVLRHIHHSDILQALHLVQSFENIGPDNDNNNNDDDDSNNDTVVLAPRHTPQHPPDPEAAQWADMALNTLLRRMDETSTRIDQDFARNQWDAVGYLKAKDVEHYLASKGVFVLQDTRVQLPLRMHTPGSAPAGLQTLPFGHSTASLSPAVSGSGSGETAASEPAFDPRTWHHANALLPVQDVDLGGGGDAGWDVDALFDWDWAGPPATTTAPPLQPVRSVLMDDLIHELVMQSICDGTGPSYPLKGIDIAVDRLIVGAA